ncbi:MAG: hypothetical protein H7070_00770 [Saprospiraceae bacterium]|nr:hypothetical protein [Pyrinomonadaceae bacterium]
MRQIHKEEVHGLGIDPETRCDHWHGESDIIAIKLKCCGLWFPCFECHGAVADHVSKVWSKVESDALAILCGGCGYQLAISEYFDCGSACPACHRAFNPGCANHYHLYFEV